MKIKDFMITDVVSVKKDTTIADLLKLLVENKIGGVPVVDDDDKLLGMISDGDVLRFLQPKGRTIYDMYTLIIVNEKIGLKDKLENNIDLPIEKMMNKKTIYSVQPDEHLENALDILSKHRFKKIPVINDTERVVGVLSRGDIMRYITTKLIH